MKGADSDLPLIDVPVPHEQRVETLVAAFREQFGHEPQGIAEAPGRVNLIGEHVDYNDGLVLPFAIDRTVMCASGRRLSGPHFKYRDNGDLVKRKQAIKIYSLDHGGSSTFLVDALDLLAPGKREGANETLQGQEWIDYAHGVAWALRSLGLVGQVAGALAGDVPEGAGLSSSAALEVAIAGAFREACSLAASDVQLAQVCQRAENEYVGVQCGIMDQFASALSRAGHALLIDCRTLAYKHVPLRLAEHGLAIVIANSAVRRELITSAYNERRRECEEAVVRLRDLLGKPSLHSLRDVRSEEMDGVMQSRPDGAGRGKRRPYEVDPAPNSSPGGMDEDILVRRARHVVREIDRVAEAVDALERDDFGRLGELMVESHLSLRDDYAVSSEQLDLLVGLATAQEYVLGARLTGAGFGGCTVNLVRADRVEDFARDVIAPYRERTGLPAVMYVTPACDGLRTWRL
jgi:galactokinase